MTEAAAENDDLTPAAAAWVALAEIKIVRDVLVEAEADAVAVAAAHEMVADRWSKFFQAEVRTMQDLELMAGWLWGRPLEFTEANASDAVRGMAAFMTKLSEAVNAGGASASETLADAFVYPKTEEPPPRPSVPIVSRRGLPPHGNLPQNGINQ